MKNKNEYWQEQARAIGGDHLVTAIEQLGDAQIELAKKLDEVARIQRDMNVDLQAVKNSMGDLVTTAFPAGDAEGHRRYHDLIIQKTEETRRLRIAIQEKTISALIWSVVVAGGALLWKGLLAYIGRL